MTDLPSALSIYVCETCGRLGPMADFQRECKPGWTHGRLIKVDPNVTGFRGLLAVARLINDANYPPDVFVGGGENTDPGVQLVVALRACDEALNVPEAESPSATPGGPFGV